ncbi:hypothetical protein CEXT_14881 [Caerostris extrusa]|uniref:Uncharacterized protein n=1 Tax=Caerostris extrusa TaxID=172846 RepID=A0AAV4SJP9_CAEEX|nr:hypothetical protein CEXT_14881 [Caerostris extrusa]
MCLDPFLELHVGCAQGLGKASRERDSSPDRGLDMVANRVKQEVGDVSILINNAGVFSGQPLVNLPSHIIREVLRSQLHGSLLDSTAVLPRMIELNRGHVVAVASIAGHQGVPYMTDYCASKYAAAGMMEALNMELQFMGKKDVHLTTINPIIITTGLISNVKSRCFSRRTRFKILDYVGYGFDPVVITKQPARNGGAEIV